MTFKAVETKQVLTILMMSRVTQLFFQPIS